MNPLASPIRRSLSVESSLAVRPASESGAEWDGFVRQARESTFCHLYGWQEMMADVLGHEPRYLLAQDGEGRVAGVLPLVHVRSRLFGRYLLSMPFLNYGGPLGTESAQRQLATHAAAEARRVSADLLELRTRHVVPCELRSTDRKVTVILDLPDTSEALWNETLRSKLRSQIRRPQKVGMVARFGEDQVRPFYEVFSRNMRDLGTPVLPLAFFERLRRSVDTPVVFGVVYLKDQPVAAGCGFIWRDEFEITWASSLSEHNRDAPNMLLYFSLMEEMIARGVRRFNFGRCTPGGGTHRFKLQWGGVDVPLPWLQWSPRGLSATPSADRPLFRAATRVWQRLPLGVTNRVGPWIARSIP